MTERTLRLVVLCVGGRYSGKVKNVGETPTLLETIGK